MFSRLSPTKVNEDIILSMSVSLNDSKKQHSQLLNASIPQI